MTGAARIVAPLAALLIMNGACGPAPRAIPVRPSPPPHPALGSCELPAPAVAFLAKESVAEEVDGLNVFVADWGARGHCFDGVVLTTLAGADLSRYRVLIVDVSPGSHIDAADRTAIDAFRASGRRVALFAWPLALPERTVIPRVFGGVESGFGGAELRLLSGCGDWQFGDGPKRPFDLENASYRYENFGDALFAVKVEGPQRVWANSLFCKDVAPVMIEVPAGIVAGFYLGYTISLADNNVRSIGLKRALVDVIHALAGPGGF